MTFLTKFFGLLAASAVLLTALPSQAAEPKLMNLYPKQRASHQAKMNQNQGKYLARGHEYVDHLYATGGEEQIDAPDDFMTDLDIEADDTVPVDVKEVAKIIKQNSPSP